MNKYQNDCFMKTVDHFVSASKKIKYKNKLTSQQSFHGQCFLWEYVTK